ncbi:hypothetical protein KUCAC02_007835 [Chaenocephalus aceratus]|uniref:Uncharacterized protein n=1 Tax=Chaenocephalus aceratus TaxID=36190 RepID=A0ACB9X6L9_CHAAC|nr:hypothetical protein KUCAC02_007835 [Chaenocephalus aceratus]
MVDCPTMRKTFVVPDIKPLDLYDCTKAKICASVGWLLAKSYGSAENVAVELRDPFYCDQYEQEHLKPPVTRLLQSSELYCRTYSLLLGAGAEAKPKDNATLLQLLTQRGLVSKDQDTPVTEADLRHKPIKMSAHLAMIDALMAVGAMETVTAVKTCGSADLLGGASSWEEALLHWVNGINQKLREQTEETQRDTSQAVMEPQPVQPSLRYRKDKIQSKQKPLFPVVNEVKDLSSGCAVAAVIHYYCPGLLRLEDVCMKESMPSAEILYNLQVIHEFCESCLKSCCNLTLEDMLYTPQELRLNWLSFLAELLSWFEVQRPEFVQPIDPLDGSTPVTPNRSSGNSSSPSIFKKPFLPISSPASEGVGKTWSKKPLRRPLSAVSFSIPFGLDSDVDVVMGNPVITRSVSSDQLNPAGQHMTRVPFTPPEDLSHLMTTLAQKSDESPSKSPQLNNEMSELETRLKEKRKAIEAQKKRIEAIFAKHRQRLGKSAFLQLKKEQCEDEGEGGNGHISTSSTEEELSRLRLDEKLTQLEEEEQDEQRLSVADDGNVKGGLQANKQISHSKEKACTPGEKGPGTPGEKTVAPLGDYNNAVSKLTAALNSLQSDMQRLTDQQNHLVNKKTLTSSNKSWVIPPSPKTSTPAPTRLSRESTRDLNSASSSPSPSRKITHYTTPPKSPRVQRRAQSVPPKSPKHHQQSRPSEVKVPTILRTITAPQNVDRIPHLRRVNPWQSHDQTLSSFSIGDSDGQDELRSPGPTPVLTPTLTPIPPPTPTPCPATDDTLSEVGFNDDHSIFSMDLEAGTSHGRKEGFAHGGYSSGAPSECSFESDVPAGLSNGKRGSLIEISLSALRGDGEEEDALSDSISERTEMEAKGGLGFFFKDDKERTDDEMAQRRAALLEKQQKRAEEMKRRKLEQEKEKELNKPQWMTIEGWGNKEDRPQTPGTPPASGTPPGDGTPHRRGDFTRQEYERRHQLKIMEDLDKVLRQKPTTVRGVKKQRPKTMFRDDSVLSHSPAKGLMGTRLNKVYSHSTMNLSSMANDLSVRKSPSHSYSPSRLMSPRRTSAHNGEKDWENGSTISSAASIPEYTGPKLYKEPSFKSNKFIIHNAITRCCMAGKVNESQKNKIVEEMETSTANHFLILFRDASCQFRAVYTMNPETEEMVRLTGIGPRCIAPEMVESIYKYSSDRKQFTAIPSKTMSMSVDAFTIPGHFWQKRPGTPKKLGTPK